MSLKLIGSCGLAISLLTTGAFAYASSMHNEVACPSVSTIQQMAKKIDKASKFKDGFVVVTSTPAFKESNLSWFVAAGNIKATTPEEAIKVGQQVIQHTTIRKQDSAEKQSNFFTCSYGPDYVMALGFKFNIEQFTPLMMVHH